MRIPEFDKETHTYTIDGKKLTSVTQFISQFKEKPNWNEIAEKVALKENKPVDLILKEWKQSGEDGRAKGTEVHSYIDKRLRGIYAQGHIEWFDEFSGFEKFWAENKSHLSPIHVEWIIGDKELGLGGTIDCLFFDHNTNKYRICDWKTGRKFRIDNRWQTLLPPFDDIEDCDLNNYSLQLSAYNLILKRNTDLTLGDPFIIRLTDSYVEYPSFDYEEAIEKYILTQKPNYVII